MTLWSAAWWVVNELAVTRRNGTKGYTHTHIIGCQEQESKKGRRQGKRKGSWGRHQWGWRRFRTHCHQCTIMWLEVFSRISLIRVGREYLTIGYQLCFFLSLSMALTGSSLTLPCLLTLKFQADLTGFCRHIISCEKIFSSCSKQNSHLRCFNKILAKMVSPLWNSKLPFAYLLL